jgi:hypothetical protein
MIDLSNIHMPDHSRVWVYQADRKLSTEEQAFILTRGKEFTSTWAAHGNELTAELYLVLDHFMIIALDEQMEAASGCSIDKSLKLVLDMQKTLGVSFTNRLISAVYMEGEVRLFLYAGVKNELEAGGLHADSLIFDNTVQNLKELKTNWLKHLKDTWLKKLLEPQNV